MSELDWSGYLNKKAFKTLSKQNWKRRFCVFEADTLTIKWYASDNVTPSTKPLGFFQLDPTDVMASLTAEHGKQNEISIQSQKAVFFGCADTQEEVQQLLIRIDAARRALIAGDDGTALIRADSDSIQRKGFTDGETGAKAYSWGVGSLLGIDNNKVQGMAVPQRVKALIGAASPTTLSAGPEHASALQAEGGLHVWGSNEFRQVAAPPDMLVVFRPIQLSSLASRKVLSIACGGSHTLAVVADGPSATGGVLVGWGTGTVGQLGLGEASQYADGPVVIPVPMTPQTKGRPVPVARAYAGLVSSACVTALGEAFVWGDASVGRLGLPNIQDSTPAGGTPLLVNASKVWTPTQLHFTAADLGPEGASAASSYLKGRGPYVTHIALGGSFSVFLLHSGAPHQAGCTMLVTGALGVDITRDTYGHPQPSAGATGPAAQTPEASIEEEIRGITRRMTPAPVAPFMTRPVVLNAFAGARHAAAIVSEDMRGGAPRLYTAGKGWLAHKDSKSDKGDSPLLERPVVSTIFGPVGGAIENVDIIEAACGHSHTVARTSEGKIYAWGRGDSGELGQGNLSDHATPTAALDIEGHVWAQVCAGSYYSIGLCEPGNSSSYRKGTADILSMYTQKWAKIRTDEASAAQQVATAAAAADKPATAALATSGNVSASAAKSDVSKYTSAPAPAPAPAPAEAEAEDEDYGDPLPDGWDYDYDEDGTIYFIRPDGETQWEDPRDG